MAASAGCDYSHILLRLQSHVKPRSQYCRRPPQAQLCLALFVRILDFKTTSLRQGVGLLSRRFLPHVNRAGSIGPDSNAVSVVVMPA